MEELPGDRQIIISASDSSSTASITLTVNVQIINNNGPVITLTGNNTAVFVEGSTLPYDIGKNLERKGMYLFLLWIILKRPVWLGVE